MITNLKLSRIFGAAIATCVLLPLAGCKHVSTWTNVSPSASMPDSDPFGYPPSNDSYLHRPEEPLSPVPALPDPGHSVPIDPPVPPAPAEAGNLAPGESLSAKGKPWALRPMSFLPRKDSRSGPIQPASKVADSSDAKSSPTLPTPKPVQLPISNLEPGVAPQAARVNSGLVAPAAGPAIGTQQSATSRSTTSDFAEKAYKGPVITPGSQYTIGREIAVENWPYTQRPVTDHATLKLRKEPQFTADDFVPAAPAQNSNLLPPPAPASPAAVPLLLPPGA